MNATGGAGMNTEEDKNLAFVELKATTKTLAVTKPKLEPTGSTLIQYLKDGKNLNSVRYNAEGYGCEIESTINRATRPPNPSNVPVTGYVQSSLPYGCILPKITISANFSTIRTIDYCNTSPLEHEKFESYIKDDPNLDELRWPMFDMSYMYAKILFYALLRQSYIQHNIPVQTQVFDETNGYSHILLPDEEETAPFTDLCFPRDELLESFWYATIFRSHEYNSDDLLVFRLLGHAGSYFQSAPGSRVIPAAAYSWDSMNIRTVSTIEVNVPETADVMPSKLFNWAYKTSVARKERQAYMRGLYHAFYLVYAEGKVYDTCFEENISGADSDCTDLQRLQSFEKHLQTLINENTLEKDGVIDNVDALAMDIGGVNLQGTFFVEYTQILNFQFKKTKDPIYHLHFRKQ